MKKSRMFFWVLVACAMLSFSPVSGEELCVLVVDESGEPVPDVNVSGLFYRMHDGEEATARTNDDGEVCIFGESTVGVSVSLTKQGFYRTSQRVFPKKNPDEFFKFVLRKKKNPVPMYVKNPTVVLPENDKVYGYDLIVGDLVRPDGEGRKAHIYFSHSGNRYAYLDFTSRLEVNFPGEDSGIAAIRHLGHKSMFKFPYLAPVDGYTKKANIEFSRTPKKEKKVSNLFDYNDKNRLLGYVFRVSASDAPAGKSSFNYGKILGDFTFAPAEPKDSKEYAAFVRFYYYFNPNSGVRSLEFMDGANLHDSSELAPPPP